MEKIININFQGRVLPIEETAYNNLKQYTDSLRVHFAREESSDEIIHDIENRIAELLNDRLKRGNVCINNSDVNAVIDSIGRLEDIEAAEGDEPQPKAAGGRPGQNYDPAMKGRFYRNADDKVIAGVCSGIANRMGIDPVIVRVLFVLLFGAFSTIYVLLWIIVPSKSVYSDITRRLYRNPDDKVIAGVCGGLAVYFRTESWVPRLLFLLPLVLGMVTGGLHAFWWHWSWGIGPRIFAGSFGSSLSILYVILWIALPYANSATDKLEMRGEKIDLNSIKAANQARNPGNYPRSSGLGRVIGIIFKAFFIFLMSVTALSLFGVLIGLVFTGFVAVPFADFILGGFHQYVMAWTGIILFLGIPFLAVITWLVRRLMGVKTHRHYLGYVFAGLWIIGLVSFLMLVGMLMSNFRARSIVEQNFQMQQPSVKKLYVNVASFRSFSHYGNWLIDWDGDSPFNIINNDSLWLTTVKVNVTQSSDSLYHIYETCVSRGGTPEDAKTLAGHISFPLSQQDSVISLPAGFCISNTDKFRNQQVLITIEVPYGKNIQFNKGIHHYNWFTVNINNGHGFNFESRDDDDDYRSNREYIMTASGLRDPLDTNDNSDDAGDDEED